MAVSNHLKIEHYILGRTIGIGAFGKVKFSRHEFTGDTVAVKIISKQRMRKNNLNTRVNKEIQFLRYFNHPNIIKLYEVLETQTDIFLVMEYASGGELFDLINHMNLIPEPRAKHIFKQIVSGVGYCHSNLVAHRDLKPENILLDENDTVKIADFGLANLMKDGKFLKTDCGSPNYVAPEIILKRKYCGTEVDTWSCGVILYSLLAGRLPFDEEIMPALFKKICDADYKMPKHFSPEVQDLIKRMLEPDPTKRIKFHQISKHPWLRNTEILYLNPQQIKDYMRPNKIDQEIVEKLKGMKFNFREFTDQKISESIKEKRDYSFVVGYNLMADEVTRKQIGAEAKRLAIEAETEQEINQEKSKKSEDGSSSDDNNSSKVSVESTNDSVNQSNSPVHLNRAEDYQKWHYGLKIKGKPRAIMGCILDVLPQLHTAYETEVSEYKVKCFYNVCKSTVSSCTDQSFEDVNTTTASTNSTSIYSEASDFNKSENGSIMVKDDHFKKNALIFDIRIYSLGTPSGDHIVDIQRTSGHSIVFLEYCQKFIQFLLKELSMQQDSFSFKTQGSI